MTSSLIRTSSVRRRLLGGMALPAVAAASGCPAWPMLPSCKT
ncbi:hypothetical protein [Comamonas sp. JUb58]|nr:hypothetical protein [Comamonas sp. JUb58]TDS82881.1 hypothetical protein EDF71_106189 [Comamonas sp. JUb58]